MAVPRVVGVWGTSDESEQVSVRPGFRVLASAPTRLAVGSDVEVGRTADGSWAAVWGWSPEGLARVAGTIIRDPDAMGRLAGDCSGVVWDAAHQALHLVRSRTGNPPLLYAYDQGIVRFSDTVEGLLDAGAARPEPDPLGIAWFLSCGYVPAPASMFRGVRKVPAAHRVTVDASGLSVSRYWRAPWGSAGREVTAQSRLRDLLTAAVDRAAPGDEPVGVLLSSGVDSSLLAAFAHHSGRQVIGFTFTYGDDAGEMNEGPAAGELASALGFEHVLLELDAGWLLGHLRELVRAYEEPFGYAAHTAALGGVSEWGVHTLLSGVCTDGWYPTAQERKAFDLAGVAPWLSGVARTGGKLPGALGRRSRTLHHLGWAPIVDVFLEAAPNRMLGPDRAEALIPGMRGAFRGAAIDQLAEVAGPLDGLDRADQYAHVAMAVDWPEHLLWWNERWGRRAGLEIRAPFTDLALENHLASHPRPRRPKADLRALAATVMPREIAYRPKFPQSVPLARWLTAHSSEVGARIDWDVLSAIGIAVDPLRAEVGDQLRHGVTDKWKVWAPLVLSEWGRCWVVDDEELVP